MFKNFPFAHCPPFKEPTAWGTFLARAKRRDMDMVCSAVVMVLPVGVFITTIPWAVATSTSTLSTPTPARPITLSCFPARIASAVTFVALRTIYLNVRNLPEYLDASRRQIIGHQNSHRSLHDVVYILPIFILPNA
jgi:hypothetical protein